MVKDLVELKHKSRRLSIKEGIFASMRVSFGDYYISPFAIAINASNSLVALLSSIAGLLGPLSQMFSSRLMEKHSRKKIILRAVFLESLIWLPLIIIGVLFNYGIITNILPLFVLLSFAIYVILANIGGPAWFSWMGDIVDEQYRGRWFAKRNLITGFVTLVLALGASFFLDFFKKNNWTIFGFMILFSLAMTGRLISLHIFKKQYEPKIKLKKGYYFSFGDFLIKAPKNNFGKFSIFRAVISFTIAISNPLVTIYLLRNLGFSYTIYMIIILAGTFFSLIAMDFWGKFADNYGNYKTICISAILLTIIPLLWILSPSPIYLLIVPSLISGIAWAGFGLSTGNFVYDNVSQEKRGVAISYYNMLIGIGTFLGAGLGALLIQFLPKIILEPIFIIFIIGCLARIIVVAIWLPKMKEIRKTKKFKTTRAFKDIIFKEAKPTLLEETHQIISIKDYLIKKPEKYLNNFNKK